MLQILSITGPIYVLILLGYLSVRVGILKPEDSRVLATFVLYFAMPGLLFSVLYARTPSEIFNYPYMVIYASGSLAVIALAYTVLRRVRKLDHEKAAMDTLGMVCPNSGFIGYPVMTMVFPALAGPVLALNMMVENFIVLPLMLTLAAPRTDAGTLRTLGKAVSNTLRMPLVIALFVGLFFSLTGLRLPAMMLRPLELLANASVPLSLFAIGAGLYGLLWKGVTGRVAPVVIGKLIIHPLVMAGMIFLFSGNVVPELSPDLADCLLITASLSMMGIYPVLAQRFGAGHTASIAMIVASIACFFTLSGLLYWFSLS